MPDINFLPPLRGIDVAIRAATKWAQCVGRRDRISASKTGIGQSEPLENVDV
jgi:hypothetical protein